VIVNVFVAVEFTFTNPKSFMPVVLKESVGLSFVIPESALVVEIVSLPLK
jgi:hypothetical protein